jgi:hypothetical protein
MNIKRKLTKKVAVAAVAFPDTPLKPVVAMPRPAVSASFKGDFKKLFRRLRRYTTK